MTEHTIKEELSATIAVYKIEIDYLEDKIKGFNEQIAAIHKDIGADNEIIEACTHTLELLQKHPANAIPVIEEIGDTKISKLWPDGDAPELEQLPEDKPKKDELALFELSDFKIKLPEGIVVFKEDYIPIRPGSSTKYQVINTDNGVFIKMLVNNVYFTFSAKTLMKIPLTANRSLFGDDFAHYFVSALLQVRKLLDDDRTVNPDAIFNKQLKTNTRPEKRTLDEVEI